jgi:hypothetical protein
MAVNCTFANNGGQAGKGGDAGIGGGFTGRSGRNGSAGQTSGGSIFNQSSIITLKNTILANSVSGGNYGGSSLVDGGSNLSSDETGNFKNQTSLNKIDPKLVASLEFNGGPTATLAILTNSPALNAGDDSACLPFDQRHARRSGRCDIGAYEISGALADFVVTVQRQTNNVVLNWPVSNLSLILESSDEIAPAAFWQTVTNVPAILTNFHSLTITATNRTRFFRLRRP